MPWDVKDARKKNRSIKSDKEARQWAAVANNTLDDCMEAGNSQKSCEGKAIRAANSSLKEARDKEQLSNNIKNAVDKATNNWSARMDNLQELTKKVGGKTHQMGDFLVVGDPEKTSTWSLPVKVNGKVDHKLMGAAKAALTVGYRGNTYEGPDKAKALTKLKALYKSEEMLWGEVDTLDVADIAGIVTSDTSSVTIGEYHDESPAYYNYAATSFVDLEQAEEADEMASKVREYTEQFKMLVSNIMYSSDVTNKRSALMTLAEEFMVRVENVLGTVEEEPEPGEMPEPAMEGMIEFAESAGHIIELQEHDQAVEVAGRSPLEMDVVIIQPGWGNKRDNHYYPANVLRRDARKAFEGVKMYATDHRESEKSVRTEVSKIKEITGFTDSGAPIGRVVVFDPDFAERVRNRAKVGELNSLECSILAMGTAKKGKAPDGKTGNIVEAIIEGRSVDWVTRAGAGGHALNLLENEPEVNTMEDQENVVTETEEVQEIEEAVLSEDEPVEVEEQKPIYLGVDVATEIINASTLPRAAKWRFGEKLWLNEQQLQTAIEDEIKYLKEITGAGRPFAMGETEHQEKDKPLTKEVYDDRVKDIFGKYGINLKEV